MPSERFITKLVSFVVAILVIAVETIPQGVGNTGSVVVSVIQPVTDTLKTGQKDSPIMTLPTF